MNSTAKPQPPSACHSAPLCRAGARTTGGARTLRRNFAALGVGRLLTGNAAGAADALKESLRLRQRSAATRDALTYIHSEVVR